MKFSAFNSTVVRGKVNSFTNTSKTVQGFQDFSVDDIFTPCPRCGSTQINLVQMPGDCKHWAEKRCGMCDRFLKWEPKPENQQKQQRQQTRIDALLKSPHLSKWEREFLTSLQGKRSLSPRQQQVLAQIELELGGAR